MKVEIFLAALVFAVASVARATEAGNFSNSVHGGLEAPRQVRDRFRMVLTNLTDEKLKTEIDDFTAYKCEVMVVITNKATDWFRLWCRSYYENGKEVNVYPGESYVFTFRPQANGHSMYECTVDYKKMFATFYVYEENVWYTCPRDTSGVFRYNVQHDGIYINDYKIRALFMGHNHYSLWENYDQKKQETDGLLMTGYVDGGMCSNVPHAMNDRASAITVCDHQCVEVWEHYKCIGKSKKFQADEGCIDYHLDYLDKIASAVKGC